MKRNNDHNLLKHVKSKKGKKSLHPAKKSPENVWPSLKMYFNI